MHAPAKRTLRLTPALVGVTLAALSAAPVRAQGPPDRASVPLPPMVTFSAPPAWEVVPGTHVSMIRKDQRPSYDMFAFENQFYVYSSGHWYRAAQINGPYLSVELNRLPDEFQNVPRERWISFPDAWASDTRSDGTVSADVDPNWTPTVSFPAPPHWIAIPRTAVYRVREDERPSFDLFRYESRFYVFRHDNWYQAPSASGPYVAIPQREVPTAFRTVRKAYWVSYPSAWTEDDAQNH